MGGGTGTVNIVSTHSAQYAIAIARYGPGPRRDLRSEIHAERRLKESRPTNKPPNWMRDKAARAEPLDKRRDF